MPRYQAIKKILINGNQYENQFVKSRFMEIGDVIDYDPNLKEFIVDGVIAKGDLSSLIAKGFLSHIGSSPIFEDANIGTITASDILFDPVGNIQSTNVQDAIEEVYNESSHATFTQENLTVHSNGQVLFLLSQTPLNNQSVSLFVNSAVYINGLDFTVSGDVITWLNRNFGLVTTDQITAAYFIDIS